MRCRFSETESVAILTVLLSRYRVEIKEEPQFASETFEQRKERVFAANQHITLTYVGSRVLLRKRTSLTDEQACSNTTCVQEALKQISMTIIP